MLIFQTDFSNKLWLEGSRVSGTHYKKPKTFRDKTFIFHLQLFWWHLHEPVARMLNRKIHKGNNMFKVINKNSLKKWLTSYWFLCCPLCTNENLKVVSATFLLVCFLYLNESTCQTRKFHFKSFFRSRENQILVFIFSNFMT